MIWEPLLSLSLTQWLVVAVIVTLTWFWLTRSKVANLPPSPGIALPVIGHLYLVRKNPRELFKTWADQLGDAFTLQMGSQTVVVLNSFDALKEALVKKADYFSDRPQNTYISTQMPNWKTGIIFSSGHNWKDQRTTSLAILRNFGMGKNVLAEKISEEVNHFIELLSRKKGYASDIQKVANISVSNVICSIIFGKRFEFEDPQFLEMMDLLSQLIQSGANFQILNFIPILRFLPFDIFKGRKLVARVSRLRRFTENMVASIKRGYDPDNLDNFIMAYMDQMDKRKKSGEKSYLDETNLARIIDNLFLAGTETTSTTILWSLLYVLNNPETQKKIYKEILEHVGTERMPNMADKPKLKYLTAFIMEVQRMASLVPFSVPHECSHETTVAGYTIPKGAQIFPNLDAVLRSEKIWGDPHTFRPERFFDGEGNVIAKEELIPFSIGRRICLGEALAKMELFLYLSSLFQRFEFLPADPENIPPLKDVFGSAVSPVPYEIRCVERII